MRIIALVLDRPTIERIFDHLGEPMQPPQVPPTRSLPQLAFGFAHTFRSAPCGRSSLSSIGRTIAPDWATRPSTRHSSLSIATSSVGFLQVSIFPAPRRSCYDHDILSAVGVCG
jgi:hypothetical protein